MGHPTSVTSNDVRSVCIVSSYLVGGLDNVFRRPLEFSREQQVRREHFLVEQSSGVHQVAHLIFTTPEGVSATPTTVFIVGGEQHFLQG